MASKAPQAPIVLVTGASKGIGKAIIQKLAHFPDEYQIYGTSRDVDTIPEENRVSGVQYLNLDLTREESRAQLVHELPHIDILVNNAGSAQNGPVEEVPMSKVRQYFEMNVFGQIALIQAYLPQMRAQGWGRIVNISSMASKSPVAFSSFYAASKAAIYALSLGLENEVHSFGIKISTIAPFEINTTLPQDMVINPSSPYQKLARNVKKRRDIGLREAPQPEIVGELAYKILHQRDPKAFYPVGKNAKLKYFLIKHLPRRMVAKQTRKMFSLP